MRKRRKEERVSEESRGQDKNEGAMEKIKDKVKEALDPYADDRTDEPLKPGDKAPPSEAWSGGSTVGGTGDDEVVGPERPGVVGEGGEEQGREERSGRGER